MIYVFLADGFEEAEALVPIDILRRGGFKVISVGVGGKTVSGAHGIPVVCDISTEESGFTGLEAVVLPGGMPGTANLEKDKAVQSYIDYAAKNNIIIGAICAAPSILGHKNLLIGKKAVCFDGYENELIGAELLNIPVVRDGNIITACGAGAAFEFGFELLAALSGDSTISENLKIKMKYTK